MSRYFKTENGKIWDINRYYNGIRYGKPVVVGDGLALYSKDDRGHETYCGCGKIVKEADAIEKLIEVGDFVKTTSGRTDTIKKIEEVDGVINFWLTCGDFMYFQYLAELYTKQGRNYVLVWTNEEGVI